MSDNQRLLDVRGLSVEFHTTLGVVQAVRDVSFHVERGETLGILGESGSGKSVSASAILGLIDCPPGRIASGEISYRGRDLLRMSREERRRINGRNIAMIFQDPLSALNPVYTAGWQIGEAFRIHGIEPENARAKAISLLERVGIPEPARRVDDYPHQFSGGQRQRVMIAMAIALKPDLLIADEPTTALDVTVQAQILALLKDLQAETAMGLLLITHDLGVIAHMADRVAVMQGGEIVETGSVATTFSKPSHPYTRRLLDSVPGRHGFPAPRQAVDEVVFSVRDLVRTYRRNGLFGRSGHDVRAVDGVSFDLKRGEVLGIVGESGSGKSTLARTMLGLDSPTSGTVEYLGRDVTRLSRGETKRFRRGIQAVFQDPTASLNPYMTVSEIVGEAWEIHPDVLPPKERPENIRRLLDQVGLEPGHAARYPHQFSGGQRQRIAIARALAIRPQVIVCDEAVSALDVSIQAQIIQLLKDLRKQHQLSFIFIAHDLDVVRDFADRVLVMHRGRVVEQGTTEQIFGSASHDYTRELLAASLSVKVSIDAS